jgi:RimJ/RimL family protein N-acetyltransferase
VNEPAVAWPNVPLLETERLRLRGHRVDDFAACAAMWADPVVKRFIGGGAPSTANQSWARLLNYIGHWPAMQFGYWAVEERATGEFVGDAGFADFKREIAPSMRDVPELGYVFAARAHGKGYATEAARAVVAWGDARGFARTVCIVHAENAASLHVAAKCGYRAFERATFGGEPAVFLERRGGAA